MSEKDTAQKTMTKYDKKIQKRKEEELKEKKKKKLYQIAAVIIAIACVAGVASIPIRSYLAKNTTYVTIGGEAVTRVEFDYYYSASVNDYINQYGTYLSYLGLDTSKDFASQAYNETLSWKDYFEQNAVSTITKTKALLGQAKENGFTYDAAKDVDKNMENIKEAAAEAGISVKTYYKATYGKYATEASVKAYLSDALFASAYYSEVADSKAATDEEITTYYNENKDSYDSVDYRLIEAAAEFEEKEAPAGTDTAKDGTTPAETSEPTEEEIAAAMKTAKKEADEKLAVVAKEGELKENQTKSSVSAKYSDWLYDSTRKAGDTTIIEDTDSNKYYVLAFEKRYLDESLTADARVIMTSAGNGDAIVEEWNTNGANEEAFISLVEKYSEDEYTNSDGGLYEGMAKSGLTPEISDWLFDAGRKAGEVTSVTMETGYTYVMYYLGQGKEQWKLSIGSTLLAETMNAYLEEIKAPFEVSDPKGNLKYLIPPTAENTSTSAADETTESSSAVPSTEPETGSTSAAKE